MNPIFNALAGGYSATQIISFIESFIPKLTPKINAAKKQGYSVEKILEFLSDTMQSEANSSYQTSHRIHAKNREENKKLTKDLLKQGLSLGATAIGANVLSKMVPNLGKVINAKANINSQTPSNIPQSPSNNPPVSGAKPQNSSPPLPIRTQPTPQAPTPTPNVGQPGPNIGQQIGQQAAAPVAQAIQPNQSVPSIPAQSPNLGSILQQIGIKDKVDALRESNPPEVISKIITAQLSKDRLKEFQDQGIPLDKVIEGYLQSAPPVETMKEKISKGIDEKLTRKPEVTQPEIIPKKDDRFKDVIEEGRRKYEEHRSTPTEIPEKPKDRILKLERGSSVLLPDGNIGEIEDIKQGIAKIKVGDRIRNKKLEELMESPKEAAIAALELIKSFTPEAKRSAHHALNMYDPQTKSAQFLFHNGEGYIVDDISPEEYERLSNEIEEAKTAGENKIGAWSTGAGSRGAAYQKIVKNLKKPYRKIQVGYNLFKEFQRLINEKEE